MSLEMVTRQRLEQRMHLSQQMLQNLELLQLPATELREFIQKELESNPVLETDPELEEPAAAIQDDGETAEERAREDMIARVEEEWLESERRTRGTRSAEDAERRMEMLNNASGAAPSLREHLAAQLPLLDISGEMKALAAHVIEHVQDSGLLKASAEELVSSLPPELRRGELGAVAEKIEGAVAVVQSLEPRGVGARSIKECLLLQLDPADVLSPLLRRFIELHLDNVGENRLPRIVRDIMADPVMTKDLGREGELDPAVILGDVKELIGEIAKLNPCPGARYSSEKAPRVFPEVVVRLVDGTLEIVLEDGWLPALSVNRSYEAVIRSRTLSAAERTLAGRMARDKKYSKPDRAMLSRLASGKRLLPRDRSRSAELARGGSLPEEESQFLADLSKDPACTKEEREFLKQKLEAGRKLISAIEQRRRTIYRISEEIVRRQKAFFEGGAEHLRPLRMQEVADALGIHLSTVSRAASEKWMETPSGVLPFRFFFASAANRDTTAPEAGTRLALLEKVRGILESEDKTHPLSDLDIVRVLHEKHRVVTARRTVAKYREELRFPATRLRKCY